MSNRSENEIQQRSISKITIAILGERTCSQKLLTVTQHDDFLFWKGSNLLIVGGLLLVSVMSAGGYFGNLAKAM